jgi:hypothetical protein
MIISGVITGFERGEAESGMSTGAQTTKVITIKKVICMKANEHAVSIPADVPAQAQALTEQLAD